MIDTPDVRFMSREQHYEDAVRRTGYFNEMQSRLNIDGVIETVWLRTIYFPFEHAPDEVCSRMSWNQPV